ncbi:FecR family protein [Sphingobium mellinum]|uniref:FecR family protein n=1 Tax=Sphingobium mellinum TaxID=1387166 RepID=UPI0030EF3033
MIARSDIDEGLLDAALVWLAALERDDADWDGYITWLEADPRHREAFDAVALTARLLDDHSAALGEVLDPTPSVTVASGARRWPWALGGGIAAALALVVGLPMLRSTQAPPATYLAAAGSTRSVALGRGTQVLLSPSSRIVVRGKDDPRIQLASGEAYFDVRHDPYRSLTIEAGPYRISDIGTHFSVNLSGSHFRVAVAEGTVTVRSTLADGELRLGAGQQVTGGADGTLSMASVAPSNVGSWRSGRLSYTDAPLPLVAADISRYSGRQIIVDASLEKRHFSGTLVIGDGSRLVQDLATIMDLAPRPGDDGVVRLGGAAP